MNTLNDILDTKNISISTLKDLWINSPGRMQTGSNFSNLDSIDVIYCLTEKQYAKIMEEPVYAAHRLTCMYYDKAAQTNVAETVINTWSDLNPAPSMKHVQPISPLELEPGVKYVLLRRVSIYGNTQYNGIQVVARVNGDNVTIFKSK